MKVSFALVRLKKINESDYISLQDIAKGYSEDWRGLVNSWIRRKETLEYLGIWGKLENDKFNDVEFNIIKNAAGVNRFRISPIQWVNRTKAIGNISGTKGRYATGVFLFS